MSKNIVLCCDGTGNGFDNPENDSNVVELYNTLAIGPKQIAYYHPGVGTMGAPNARNRLEQEWTRVKGLGFAFTSFRSGEITRSQNYRRDLSNCDLSLYRLHRRATFTFGAFSVRCGTSQCGSRTCRCR